MALYPRQLLAMDAQVKDSGGFGGITLAQKVSSKMKLTRRCRKLLRQVEAFSKKRKTLSGEVTPVISLIQMATHGKWHGHLFLNFGKAN